MLAYLGLYGIYGNLFPRRKGSSGGCLVRRELSLYSEMTLFYHFLEPSKNGCQKNTNNHFHSSAWCIDVLVTAQV
jgi:hypothetical protein